MKLRITYAVLMLALTLAGLAPASSQVIPPPVDNLPFTATLSNTTPLAFGMDVADAARALRTPLTYVSGRAGDEIFLTFRSYGGGGLFPRSDRLFLQFRHGRLTGWKGDWGRNWMWR